MDVNDYRYGTYSITYTHSIPLVVLDEIKSFIQTHGCNFENKDGYALKLTDVTFKPSNNKKEEYPVPYYVYTNTVTGKTYEFEWGEFHDPNTDAAMLGTVYSHKKVKAKYKLVDIIREDNDRFDSDYRYRTVYVAVETEKGDTIKSSEIDISGEKVKPDFFSEAISGSYVSILTAVEKPSDAAERYGKTTTIKDEEKGITKYSYVDNIIDMLILGSSEGFYFELKNIGQNSIKVIWNEAVFVDYDGNTSNIMHNGIKYSEREGDQPATTIIKGAKISDQAIPIANVCYDEGYLIGNERHGNIGWHIKSMYPKKIIDNPGQLILMLPIQVKGIINEYIFVFDVKYVYKHPELLNL